MVNGTPREANNMINNHMIAIKTIEDSSGFVHLLETQ